MSRDVEPAAFFDRVADEGVWDDFREEDGPKLKRLLRRLDLKHGMTVVEPGCGAGRLTEEMWRKVAPNGRIIASDISPRMVARARKRRLGRRVRFIVGPVEELNLKPASADRVVCFQSFPHFDEKRRVLRLFREWLKPDGLLAIVHFSSRHHIHRIHRAQPAPIHRHLIPTRKEMLRMLDGAGFTLSEFDSARDGYWLFADPT